MLPISSRQFFLFYSQLSFKFIAGLIANEVTRQYPDASAYAITKSNYFARLASVLETVEILLMDNYPNLTARCRINSSNAGAFAKLRWEKYRQRKLMEQTAALSAPDSVPAPLHDPLRAETVRQLNQIDERIGKLKGMALANQLPALTRAKQTLWHLLFPKPIQGKPKRGRATIQSLEPIQS